MKIHIQIPKRNSHCSQKGEAFKEGDAYFSILIEEESSFIRKDFCQTCWQMRDEKTKNPIWKGKIPIKKELASPLVEKPLQLFKSWVLNGENPKLQYLLAQLLLRKKMLYKAKHEFYELPYSGEVFHVKTVVLKAGETEELAKTLAESLNGQPDS